MKEDSRLKINIQHTAIYSYSYANDYIYRFPTHMMFL